MSGGAAIARAGTATCPLSFDAAPRVVFDTNVLVSLYVFDDSRYAPLREAFECGHLQAITSAACLGEFERVLAYPQFAFAPPLQAEALAQYARHALELNPPASAEPLPRCKDPDDQKFLELTRDSGAGWLVTADKALLVLARRQRLAHLFRIVTPDAAMALFRLEATDSPTPPTTAARVLREAGRHRAPPPAIPRRPTAS